MSLVYLCVFSSGVYLYFGILMYVKRHKQFEIGCGAILNKVYEFEIGCGAILNKMYEFEIGCDTILNKILNIFI